MRKGVTVLEITFKNYGELDAYLERNPNVIAVQHLANNYESADDLMAGKRASITFMLTGKRIV